MIQCHFLAWPWNLLLHPVKCVVAQFLSLHSFCLEQAFQGKNIGKYYLLMLYLDSKLMKRIDTFLKHVANLKLSFWRSCWYHFRCHRWFRNFISEQYFSWRSNCKFIFIDDTLKITINSKLYLMIKRWFLALNFTFVLALACSCLFFSRTVIRVDFLLLWKVLDFLLFEPDRIDLRLNS